MDNATIAAIATPPGEGGIGMVRISGTEAKDIAGRIFRRGRNGHEVDLTKVASHRLLYGRVVDPASGETIDEVLLGWMAAPHTYTCEDIVELTCHGGLVPLQETLRVALAAGARHAEPGEFTLRAFLNGRLDLTQAEAVLNVVGARTGEALRLAVDDLSGNLTRRLTPARDAVVSLLAFLDAAADFPEDEIPPTDIDADLATAEEALAEIVAGSRAGMLYQEGAQIALVGRPNVGKSSLMNALLRADRAIVTPVAGTTRDVISETINLRGIPATLLDTAGIAETADVVELLGIERSRKALTASAAAVLVLDGSVPPTEQDFAVAQLLVDRLGSDIGPDSAPVVIAVNKRDLPERAAQDDVTRVLPGCPVIAVSCVTSEGIDELEDALAGLLGGAGDARPSLITARQHAVLDRALEHIRNAVEARATGYPIDLLATDVRAALHAIGEVTGEAVDDAVLTEIFSRFCIGK
ncbi:MAG TPA: tRNA uridine-5-carboxymethylaminomethyl(34) synthesis GTPase MnmE [Thermomicrobiales bacterium]|nr:tRNA uridine-5-carboxymethylaminomethyl(34) synthesis GTPase MnmE [Thermomicrobiales bacterium]